MSTARTGSRCAPRRSNPSYAPDVMQPLESRRLLAATVNFAGGVLTITGTAAAERLFVVPVPGDPTSVRAVVDTTVAQTVALNQLNQIVITGGAGNDSITVYHTITVPANIRGGLDADTIHGGGGDDFIAGEKGNDYVYGGAGNDLITGGGQKNHLYGEDGDDKAIGGDGRDFIFGGAGKDKLYGNLGDDDIDGGGGNDRIWGSSDNDYLLGGTGNDRIYGNSETDTLGGGLGQDTLIGGENAGEDVAYCDSIDIVTQCEVIKRSDA